MRGVVLCLLHSAGHVAPANVLCATLTGSGVRTTAGSATGSGSFASGTGSATGSGAEGNVPLKSFPFNPRPTVMTGTGLFTGTAGLPAPGNTAGVRLPRPNPPILGTVPVPDVWLTRLQPLETITTLSEVSVVGFCLCTAVGLVAGFALCTYFTDAESELELELVEVDEDEDDDDLDFELDLAVGLFILSSLASSISTSFNNSAFFNAFLFRCKLFVLIFRGERER